MTFIEWCRDRFSYPWSIYRKYSVETDRNWQWYSLWKIEEEVKMEAKRQNIEGSINNAK
jgi:hypothetical protein